MQATVNIPTLKSALTAIRPAVRSRDAILSATRIEACGSRLTVAATDEEVTIRTTVAAQVNQPGNVAIEHKTLVELLHGRGSIELETSGDRLVATNGSRVELGAIPDDRLPILPADSSFTRSVKLSVAALRQVVDAAADSERPFTSGVLLAGATMTATDLYRLHTTSVEGMDVPGGVVVPAKWVRHMLRKVPDGVANITMLVDDNARHVQLRVAGSPLSWTVRTIDDAFPPTDRLWPGVTPNRLVVDRDTTLALLDAVIAAMPNDDEPVQLVCAPAVDVAVVLDRFGEDPYTAELPGRYAGESLAVRYNPKFLRDAVAAVNARSVAIDIPGALKAAVVAAEDDTDPFRALLMPVER